MCELDVIVIWSILRGKVLETNVKLQHGNRFRHKIMVSWG